MKSITRTKTSITPKRMIERRQREGERDIEREGEIRERDR
jgi:hypothetical protein